jgi:hypothetical protein
MKGRNEIPFAADTSMMCEAREKNPFEQSEL